MFRGIDADGDWAVRFEAHDGINCYAVVAGQVRLAVEGVADVLLGEGDCVLLRNGHACRLGSALDVPPRDAWSGPSWSIALAARTLAMVGRDQNIALLFRGEPA